ncbi:MAG: alpha/beta fold hydrolase [Candidatus Izemoplasmataceae bacterium]
MKKIFIMIIAWGVLNLVAYLFVFEKGYMVSWGLFGILLVCSLALLFIFVLMLIFTGAFELLNVSNAYLIRKLPGVALFTVFTVVLLLMQIALSDKFVYMPGDLKESGWTEVELNGTNQYISVRTNDETNPVILFLAGGPGGSQIQATREHFDQLEEEYTIINWEQQGSGKSYNAREIDSITIETYIEDGHALTTYLKERFNQEKIYIIGESWGSYIGIELATRYPEDYEAIITTGQMVDFAETEVYCYEKALEVAYERQDEQQIKALENLDEVPVKGKNISLEIGTYLTYLHGYMNEIDEINRTSWDTLDSLFSPEYNIMDSFNFIRALYYTFSHVFQQLYETDLRETHTSLDIPIYILHGRHDLNAPSYLVDDYYELLEAPEKELIYFEHSGHNPWITEPVLFQQTVLDLLNQD